MPKPAASDKTKPVIHGSLAPSTSKVSNVPAPAGITPPVNEKPSTVVPLAETVKPFAAASPPVADTIVPSVILN